MKTHFNLQILTIFILIPIIYTYQCSDIQDESLCTPTPGCNFVSPNCQGTIETPTICSTKECLFIDPGHSSDTQTGTLASPFKQLQAAIEKTSTKPEEVTYIFGVQRRVDDIFTIGALSNDAINIIKSFVIQPLVEAHMLKFEHSFITENFMQLKDDLAFDISVTFKKSIFTFSEFSEFTGSSVPDLMTLGEDYSKWVSFTFDDAYFRQINTKLSHNTFHILINENIHVKYLNLIGKFSEIPLPNLSFDVTRRKGTLEFTDCQFSEGSILLPYLAISEHIKMTRISFQNMKFGFDNILGSDDAFLTLYSAFVELDEVTFKNIELHNTNLNPNRVFLSVQALKTNINKLTFESSTHMGQFLAIESKNLTLTTIKATNIITSNPIIKLTDSESNSIKSIEFDKIFFKRDETRPKSVYGTDIVPLCMMIKDSNIRIQDSTFKNITSQCIRAEDSKLNLESTDFSNQNLDSYLKSQTLQLASDNWVNWVFVNKSLSVVTSSVIFHTNYLRAPLGGGLHCHLCSVIYLQSSRFINLTAGSGGGLYSIGSSSFTLFFMRFQDNNAIRYGGAMVLQANKLTISLFLYAYNNTAGYKGSVIHADANAIGDESSVLFSIFNIEVLQKDQQYNQLTFVGYNTTTLKAVSVSNDNVSTLVKADNVIQHFVNFDYLNQYNQKLFVKSSDDYFMNNQNNRTPKYIRFQAFQLDDLQITLQDPDYFSSIKSRFEQYKANLTKVADELIQISKANPQKPSGFTIKTKNGQFLPTIFQFEIHDQYGAVLDKDILVDGLKLQFLNTNTSASQPISPIEQEERFTSNSIIFAVNKQLRVEDPSSKSYALKIEIIRVKAPSYLAIQANQIELTVPIEFTSCAPGEELISSEQTCRPCANSLFSFTDDARCVRCQENSICHGSNILLPSPGYWRHDQKSPQSIKCPFSEDCLGGNKTTFDSEILSNEIDFNGYCKFPTQGNLCNQCMDGYARANPQSACVHCKSDVQGFLYFGFMLLIQILLIIILTAAKIKSSIEKGKRATQSARVSTYGNQSEEEKTLRGNKSISIHYLSQLIKITFNYSETMRIINQYSVEKLPIVFSTFISVFSSSVPSQDAAFSIQCLIELFTSDKTKHYYIRYLSVLAKPFALLIVILLIFFVYFLIVAIKGKKNRERGSSKRKPILKQVLHNIRGVLVTVIIVILYFSQSHIIIASLDLFNCQNLHPENGRKDYLFQDSNIECWVGTHKTLVYGVAIPILVVFGLFIPLFSFYKLRKQMLQKKSLENSTNNSQSESADINSNSQSKKSKLTFGQQLEFVLVKGSIQEENYFWELLVTFRKSIFIAAFVVLRRINVIEALVVALLIILAFAVLHSKRNPYKFKTLNALELDGYCSISLLLMALIILNGSNSENKVTGLILNILFSLYALYFFLMTIPRIILVAIKIRQFGKGAKKLAQTRRKNAKTEAKLKNTLKKQNDDNLVELPPFAISEMGAKGDDEFNMYKDAKDRQISIPTEQNLLNEDTPYPENELRATRAGLSPGLRSSSDFDHQDQTSQEELDKKKSVEIETNRMSNGKYIEDQLSKVKYIDSQNSNTKRTNSSSVRQDNLESSRQLITTRDGQFDSNGADFDQEDPNSSILNFSRVNKGLERSEQIEGYDDDNDEDDGAVEKIQLGQDDLENDSENQIQLDFNMSVSNKDDNSQVN